MTESDVLKRHLSALGKKGAKARVKKHGRGIYADMARKRWAKTPAKVINS